jgi:hypothetical protein
MKSLVLYPFTPMDRTVNPSHRYAIVLLLIVATPAVYWQAGNHDFITYDDHAASLPFAVGVVLTEKHDLPIQIVSGSIY